MSVYKTTASSSKSEPASVPPTEFEILKASHQFLRDEAKKETSWDDQLAQKYYDNLYREFAVCDLKHYKSGNFALRWRTESEVLSGAGETTCGNTRCKWHAAENAPSQGRLLTLELPFSYHEHGEDKSALVKVVLCDRCCKKLMWKRNKERAAATSNAGSEEEGRTKRRRHDEKGKRGRSSRSLSPHERDSRPRRG